MRRRNEPVSFRHSGKRVIPKYNISHDDFQRLRPNSWIGDEIINGYGSLIENVTGPDIIILPSFFLRQIVIGGYAKVSRWLKVSCVPTFYLEFRTPYFVCRPNQGRECTPGRFPK
jgi:hypothetical protein